MRAAAIVLSLLLASSVWAGEVTKKQHKKLKKRVAAVEQNIAAMQRQPAAQQVTPDGRLVFRAWEYIPHDSYNGEFPDRAALGPFSKVGYHFWYDCPEGYYVDAYTLRQTPESPPYEALTRASINLFTGDPWAEAPVAYPRTVQAFLGYHLLPALVPDDSAVVGYMTFILTYWCAVIPE